jgi:bacterioferritin-associated ferredoxin
MSLQIRRAFDGPCNTNDSRLICRQAAVRNGSGLAGLPARVAQLRGTAAVIVCVCRRVSDRDIHRAVDEGARSFDDVQTDLGVATACGSCLDCARTTWAEACSRTCGGLPGRVAGVERAGVGA